MKRLVGVALAIFLSCAFALAQPMRHSHEGRFYVGAQLGPMLNIYENYFSYKENGKTLGLITYQAGLVGGYDVNDISVCESAPPLPRTPVPATPRTRLPTASIPILSAA